MANASKTMVIMCIVALVVAACLSPGSAAKSIGYGAIRRGIVACGGVSQRPCLPPPSNGYNRGCEKSQGCRGNHDEPEEEPVAQDMPAAPTV